MIYFFYITVACSFLSTFFLFLESTSTFECSGNLGDYIFISRSCEHKTLEPVASYIEHESRAYSTISRWINKYINRISGQKPHRGVHLKLVDSTNPICIGDRSSFLQWWPSTPLFLFFFFFLSFFYLLFFLSFFSVVQILSNSVRQKEKLLKHCGSSRHRRRSISLIYFLIYLSYFFTLIFTLLLNEEYAGICWIRFENKLLWFISQPTFHYYLDCIILWQFAISSNWNRYDVFFYVLNTILWWLNVTDRGVIRPIFPFSRYFKLSVVPRNITEFNINRIYQLKHQQTVNGNTTMNELS